MNPYTEPKVDVTQEIKQRAQQAAQAGADHCALCSISCVTSTLASVYMPSLYYYYREMPGTALTLDKFIFTAASQSEPQLQGTDFKSILLSTEADISELEPSVIQGCA